MAKKISELTAATVITPTDRLEIEQGGASKSGTIDLIAAAIAEANKHVQTVGDASAVLIDVAHNLGTRNVVCSVRRTVAPYDQVIVDNEATDDDHVRFAFAGAPASNEFTVTIIR